MCRRVEEYEEMLKRTVLHGLLLLHVQEKVKDNTYQPKERQKNRLVELIIVSFEDIARINKSLRLSSPLTA